MAIIVMNSYCLGVFYFILTGKGSKRKLKKKKKQLQASAAHKFSVWRTIALLREKAEKLDCLLTNFRCFPVPSFSVSTERKEHIEGYIPAEFS